MTIKFEGHVAGLVTGGTSSGRHVQDVPLWEGLPVHSLLLESTQSRVPTDTGVLWDVSSGGGSVLSFRDVSRPSQVVEAGVQTPDSVTWTVTTPLDR